MINRGRANDRTVPDLSARSPPKVKPETPGVKHRHEPPGWKGPEAGTHNPDNGAG